MRALMSLLAERKMVDAGNWVREKTGSTSYPLAWKWTRVKGILEDKGLSAEANGDNGLCHGCGWKLISIHVLVDRRATHFPSVSRFEP